MPVFSMQVPIYCKHAENRAFGNLYGISVLEPSFDFDLDKKRAMVIASNSITLTLLFFRTPAIILFRESLPNLHIIKLTFLQKLHHNHALESHLIERFMQILGGEG